MTSGRTRVVRLPALLLIVSGTLCGGCGGKTEPRPKAQPAVAQPAPAPQPKPQTRPAVSRRGTLFERLGGESVVRAVVDDFVSRAASDPAVNFTRQGHPNPWQATPERLERLKERLVEFVSTTAGGPAQYRGNDMVTAHRGMAITNAEFDALAGHLRAALEANGVPRREREELLGVVASLRGAVVEAPDAPPAEAPTADATTESAPAVDAPPEANATNPPAAAPLADEATADEGSQESPPEEPSAAKPDQPDESKPDAAPEAPAPQGPAPDAAGEPVPPEYEPEA